MPTINKTHLILSYLTVLHMIGRSKMNERLHDMITKKYNKPLILIRLCRSLILGIMAMVFNATFNNNSVISW
jgi:hypothetical protein